MCVCVCVRCECVYSSVRCMRKIVYVCEPVYTPACLHVSVCSTTYTIRCAHQFQFNVECSTHALGQVVRRIARLCYTNMMYFFIVTISAQSYFSHSLRSFELERIVKLKEYCDSHVLFFLLSFLILYYEDLYCLLNCVPFARLMEIHLHTCVRNRANKTYYYSIG